MPTTAIDHDFPPEITLIPYGIFIPECNELFGSMSLLQKSGESAKIGELITKHDHDS
jgi:hypothetical protein